MNTLAVILFVAFITESLVEAVAAPLFDNVPGLKNYKPYQLYVAMLVGVLAAFLYRFDLIAILADYAGAAVPVTPFGLAVTGLAIGRGAGFVHDIMTKFFRK